MWHPLIWRYSAATIHWDCEWYSLFNVILHRHEWSREGLQSSQYYIRRTGQLQPTRSPNKENYYWPHCWTHKTPKVQKPPTKTLVKWIELLYEKNWPTNPPAELTLIKSLNVLHQKHRKAVLEKNTQVLNEFSCSTYCLPVPKVHVQPKLTQRPKVRNNKRQSLLHRQQLHAYERTTKELAAELHATQDSFGIPKAMVKALEKKAGHTITRNIHP